MKLSPYLTVTAVLAATTLINPGIASAHDWIISTTPAENSTGPAPTSVSMTFNEAVTNADAWVLDANNTVWSAGPLKGSGAAYTLPLRPQLPPGVYSVHWQNNAADGDAIHSSWLFTVN